MKKLRRTLSEAAADLRQLDEDQRVLHEIGALGATANIHFRCTPVRKQLYIEAAASAGMKLSEWITQQLDRGAQPRSRRPT